MGEIVVTCKRCSQTKPPNQREPHLCDDCVKAENNRVSFFRNQNANWIEIAREADLQLWERQPAETDHEYHIWLRYRDAYPGRRPSYRMVAEELNTTVGAVKKIGARWDFPTRLQAWAKNVDEITLAQRTKEIKEMNKTHVTMAQTLNKKLETAIAQIDPYSLSPREINSLMKTAAELERKARLDDPVAKPLALDDENPHLKKDETKKEDIGEIIKILGGAGLLGNNFGVKQTTVTEVVVQDD
jgi:hypothetical protein